MVTSECNSTCLLPLQNKLIQCQKLDCMTWTDQLLLSDCFEEDADMEAAAQVAIEGQKAFQERKEKLLPYDGMQASCSAQDASEKPKARRRGRPKKVSFGATIEDIWYATSSFLPRLASTLPKSDAQVDLS